MSATSTPREVRTETYAYVFSGALEPIASVEPGEVVDIYTDDAFGSRVQSSSDLPSQVLDWPYVNPQTGPIFVEGAEPGDTLAVTILEIEPTRDFAVSAHIPEFGGLVGTAQTAMLNDPLPEQVFVYPLRDGGEVELPRGIVLPYRPFVGTIATAPALEALSTLTSGPSGGNMDVPDTGPGATVHLPVNVPGALFFTGDAHASQGDGELCGVACEIPARVRVSFELLKGRAIAWPRVVTDDELMAIGCARPLEDAARIAWRELIRWLVADHGFDTAEAYQLMTQAGRMRLGNMVDPQYTMVARIDRALLPVAEA